MINVTDQILTEAIESLPEVFDSHAVIRKVMTQHPRQYADDLGETAGNDPIRTLHAAIGSRLAAFEAITKVEKVSGTNIRGGENENQQWRKQT
jgi:hypothetical protein